MTWHRWSADEISYLHANWAGPESALLVSMALGRGIHGVILKASLEGLPTRRERVPRAKPEKTIPRRHRHEPTKDEWVSIATRKAVEAGLSPVNMLAGATRPLSYTRVRWEAWREALTLSPNYSMAGVGRVSGFDASSVLHAMRRLKEIEHDDHRSHRI